MKQGAALLCLGVGLWVMPCAAWAERFVTPRAVIYPRQIIRADMLEQRDSQSRRVGGPSWIQDADDVVGKAARATLLPGRPIARDLVGEPQIVRIGSSVSLVFRAVGMDIRAAGVALQAAAAGDTIRARNTQTSAIVAGVLREDGAVIVGEDP